MFTYVLLDNLIKLKFMFIAKTIYVMRSVWFSYNGEPLEEKSSDLIENKHLDLFKDKLLPNLISNDVCASNERNNNNNYY
jgi:hypothetical protein